MAHGWLLGHTFCFATCRLVRVSSDFSSANTVCRIAILRLVPSRGPLGDHEEGTAVIFFMLPCYQPANEFAIATLFQDCLSFRRR